ncbi:MAG: ComEA family DNA-binding protein [Rubrivivax sp.]|jgi:competence protein ComEA
MKRILVTLLLAACAAAAPLAFAGSSPVDVNKASQAELETVKGIGPAMSAKILAARKSGEFKGWDDLVDRVGGLGPGNARRMSDAGLRVAGDSYNGAGGTSKPVRYVSPERKERAEKADKSDKARKHDKAAEKTPATQG